jgi:hypothetical protein
VRRVPRILLNALTALSLILFAATVAAGGAELVAKAQPVIDEAVYVSWSAVGGALGCRFTVGKGQHAP